MKTSVILFIAGVVLIILGALAKILHWEVPVSGSLFIASGFILEITALCLLLARSRRSR
ncbi:GldL-related protein [Capnocytophaga ochracea]|uniref:Gliding motility protein GldL-like N-terminal domain-containing protein n=1 Tax=Capnocytophaga ochracea TaxID=1018 RepID=A0A2X2SYR5_CAPOC|nr:Uncharacterised protein [Capnocytophaga ochracea]